MKKRFALIALGMLATAQAQARGELACTYAPSQSKLVGTALGAVGGAGGTVAALAQATGMTVVAHSSGAYILTGSSGYVAGTLGTTALAGPAIVAVTLLAGTAAVTVELLCAPQNHPAMVARIHAAAEEFRRRTEEMLLQAPGVVSQAGTYTNAVTSGIAAKVKEVGGDVYRYAYRKE